MRKYLLMLGASIALAIPLAAVTDAAARDYRINSWKNDPSCAEAKEKLAQGELMTNIACRNVGEDSCLRPCTRSGSQWYTRLASGWRGCADQPANCLNTTCTIRFFSAAGCGASSFIYQTTQAEKHCGLPTMGAAE